MISVIIPCYNNEKYIEDAVNSVLFGKYQDFEILIVNDGSTDNSLNIINNLASKDNRIKVINQSHGGVSKARNTGIDNAKGEYIAFIDGDDFVSYDYLDSLSKFIMDNNLDWIRCGYRFFTDIGKTYSEERGMFFSKDTILSGDQLNNICEIVIYYIPSNCMSLFKTNIIKDNNLRLNEDITYGEDLLFNYVFSHYIKRFGYVCKHLYVYAHNIKSASHNDKNMALQSTIFLMEKIEKCRLSFKEDLSKNELSFFLKRCWDCFKEQCTQHTFIERRKLCKGFVEEINNNQYTKYLWEQLNRDNVLNEKLLRKYAFLMKKELFEIMWMFYQ